MAPLSDEDGLARARNVRLVVLDVDGVLTDGSLCYSGVTDVVQRFNVKDGLGIELLAQAGIRVALLSARDSISLRRRARELNIVELIVGMRDKLGALRELSQKLKVPMGAICYVGDDLLDVPCLKAVGFGVVVEDASDCAKSCAHYSTLRRGGQGAVREVTEYILAAQSRLGAAYDQVLQYVNSRPATANGFGGKFGVIIPARFGSTRLPGKPLRLICEKPLISHVYQNALKANADFTIVATDDPRIAQAIHALGGDVELTSTDHASGTDRLAEVIRRRRIDGDTIVVNLQGDEPLLDSTLVPVIATSLVEHPSAGIATIATPIIGPGELLDPNVVKVVVDHQGFAQYFSRAPIPWKRDEFPLAVDVEFSADFRGKSLCHVGIYGYRARTLLKVASLPRCDTERLESLEQLRALYWGIPIHVSIIAGAATRGVDTEADLEFVQEVLARQGSPAT
jgi:3-deoxy-manno-octulosonate cytidylyltransferase (CMP-KDO synthetase)